MSDEDILSFARKVPLFHHLTTRDLEAVCKAMVPRSFAVGEAIVHENDDESRTFFIIAEGNVHVVSRSPEGKQTILATLGRGDFFGEMAVLDGEPRSASVVAAEECRLFMLYHRNLLHILNKHPRIAIEMLVAMSRRLRRSNRQINTLSQMSVYGRVADVLLRLAADQGGRTQDGSIVIANRPTQQVIADMANTTRETVSRILSQLQKKGCISIDKKKMVILNEEKLYY
ncbi:MAG: cyclic nucleotide-binding domain-containing protein [Chitinivibrionales bacterium]|nr:cyclic nucleotide-binding domain-containing protein [Chitinivibrionales bacterium]MBD3357394.1 cyclic nucleotide-binding domain-containing protein [Chitinivibrionales bacterium]